MSHFKPRKVFATGILGFKASERTSFRGSILRGSGFYLNPFALGAEFVYAYVWHSMLGDNH